MNGITTKQNQPYRALMNSKGAGSGNHGPGPHDRVSRFKRAAKAFHNSIQRNASYENGGSSCPVLVEGLNDVKTLRDLGFTGDIEKVNRGWPISRLVAYLHDTYGIRNIIDNRGSVILLMDWDRTGGRLQKSLRERLESLDVKIDEDLREELMKAMKPEGGTVESIRPHVPSLLPLISQY